MINKNKKEKGITMAEAVVYMAISFVLILSIISFIFWLVNSNAKARSAKQALDNANKIMKTISLEIKEADSLYSPVTSSSQLSLETGRYLPDGELTSYIDFYLCGSNICLKRESQDPVALNSGDVEVAGLIFTPIVSGGSTSIQIDLEVRYKNPANRAELNSVVILTSTASIRKY